MIAYTFAPHQDLLWRCFVSVGGGLEVNYPSQTCTASKHEEPVMHTRLLDVVNRKDRICQTAHVFTKRPEARKTLSGIMLSESEDNAFFEVLMQHTNDQNSLRGILVTQCMHRILHFPPTVYIFFISWNVEWVFG